MNCDDLLRVLAEYEEGLADQCLCSEIDRHLAECTHCQQLRQDLERVSRLCRESPPARLPDDLRARIRQALGINR
jgi:hypothetical protein